MPYHPLLSLCFIFSFALSSFAQEKPDTPVELEVIKASIGVWDAKIEVWPRGLDAPSIKFEGVETNRAFGEHWIASDLVSEVMGQTNSVHSIVGYDLTQKQLVGTVVDQGPYAASMKGSYDSESKTVTWMTEAKDVDGTSILQKTQVTQTSDDERVLILYMPAEEEDPKKFMQINFTRQK